MGKLLVPVKTVSIAAALLLGVTLAAEAFTLRAYNGDVIFNHTSHKNMFACKDCHEGAPRHMDLNKTTAHKLCFDCHIASKAGPVKHCGECHKKS